MVPTKEALRDTPARRAGPGTTNKDATGDASGSVARKSTSTSGRRGVDQRVRFTPALRAAEGTEIVHGTSIRPRKPSKAPFRDWCSKEVSSCVCPQRGGTPSCCATCKSYPPPCGQCALSNICAANRRPRAASDLS